LQQSYNIAQLQCEDLRRQVADLESERTRLQDHVAMSEKQQNLLQVHIDNRTRQYNERQLLVGSLEEQVQHLEGSLAADRTQFEDEKRRNIELQASVVKLKSNVDTLEHALSQSNDCLKVHVEHVDAQQNTNDNPRRQAEELKICLESARREIADNKQEIMDQHEASRRLGSKVKELERSLQSTKDCLDNEKSLSNAGQASTATLTMEIHQLEHSLNEARKEITSEMDAMSSNSRISSGRSTRAIIVWNST